MINDLVTVDQILDIDNVILTNSKKAKKHNVLIKKNIYNNFDVLFYRKQFLVLFNDFRKVYDYDQALKSPETKVTTNYDATQIDKNKPLSNPVAKYVDSIIDDYIRITKLYNATIELSRKFTYEESVYFINTFLIGNTEVKTADILGIVRQSIDKYKKSCLFKMMVDLSEFLDE